MQLITQHANEYVVTIEKDESAFVCYNALSGSLDFRLDNKAKRMEMETGVAMDIGTILTSLRCYTFELKTTMPFHVVGQENKQVHLLADGKRDVENNGSRSYQVCRRLPPPFCSTMADEKTDLSNNEQVVVCLRCVDNSLNLSDCNELIH